MEEATVRGLVARTEDAQLDFKQAPYSSNEELAKDLMAMANLLALERIGHILLGVRQRADGTGEIVGTTLGGDRDAQYQQKVSGRLNRTPQFTFLPLQLPEGEIGVFEVTGVGKRPYFPIGTKGILKKFVPQKRVGSSTADASPDEVRDWVLEDNPVQLSTAAMLERIPQSERARILLVTDTLNERFAVLRTGPYEALLLALDNHGSSASFRLTKYDRDLSIPFTALSAIWRDGSQWKVVIDGYVRSIQNGTVFEYQPRSRAER